MNNAIYYRYFTYQRQRFNLVAGNVIVRKHIPEIVDEYF